MCGPGRLSPGCPLTFPGAASSAPCQDATALCKFIPQLSSIHTLNLTPNYKIIGNPTSFCCKTLPPRTIISRLIAPCIHGVRRIDEEMGRRQLVFVIKRPSLGHRGRHFDIYLRPTTIGNRLALGTYGTLLDNAYTPWLIMNLTSKDPPHLPFSQCTEQPETLPSHFHPVAWMPHFQQWTDLLVLDDSMMRCLYG